MPPTKKRARPRPGGTKPPKKATLPYKPARKQPPKKTPLPYRKKKGGKKLGKKPTGGGFKK